MEKKGAQRERVMDELEHRGGLRPGVAKEVQQETGIPEADVYGVATFYTLLSRPGDRYRVCQGLTCKLADCDSRVEALREDGETVDEVSCLGQCDRAPVAIDPRLELVAWGRAGEVTPDDAGLPMNLGGADDPTWPALRRARELGAEAVLDALQESGLQGRGGAGFPAHLKWRSVRGQTETTRYVVVNADESEPGTFKDREVMLRRPHLMLEGMAIAALWPRPRWPTSTSGESLLIVAALWRGLWQRPGTWLAIWISSL